MLRDSWNIITILFFLLSFTARGQNHLITEDFGDSQNSYISSEGNIRIPLCSIKTDYTTIPVYLIYDTRGVLINEVPSSVGFGWELKAGGEVTRQINHILDESFDEDYEGWFSDHTLFNLTHQTNSHYGTSLITNANSYKNNDIAPDIFLMKMSNGDYVKFFYEKKLDSNNNIDITPYVIKEKDDFISILVQDYERFENIRFKKSDGTIYRFKKGAERLIPFDLDEQGSAQITKKYTSNFYLEKITSDLNDQEINFEYIETELSKFTVLSSAKREMDDPDFPDDDADIVTDNFYRDIAIQDVSRKEIKKIISEKKIIEFVYKVAVVSDKHF